MPCLEDMKAMPLNSRIMVSDYLDIVRVPNGWMYIQLALGYDDGKAVASCFVPEHRTLVSI